jgi:hypothetical protein
MALTFQQALYGVGAFLALFGGTFAIMSAGPSGAQTEFFDALAYGFTASFFALFSGVLIGIGAALFILGMLLGTKGSKAHIAGAFVFSVLSFFLGISAVAKPEASTFPMLVVFFAGLAASGAFFLSVGLFGFSSALKKAAYGKKA